MRIRNPAGQVEKAQESPWNSGSARPAPLTFGRGWASRSISSECYSVRFKSFIWRTGLSRTLLHVFHVACEIKRAELYYTRSSPVDKVIEFLRHRPAHFFSSTLCDVRGTISN